VKIAKEDCLSAYVRKVYSTIANYHFTKWSQLAGSWAADKQYWVKICSIINDFDSWNAKQGEEPEVPTKPTDYSDVTWHNAHIIIDEKTRQMEIGLASYAGGTLRSLGRFSVDSGLLSAYLSKFPNAKNIVKAEPAKAWPTDIPTDPIKPPPPPPNKRILLDIGHALANSGASSNNGVVKEYELNKYAIECMQKVLIAKGFQADIYDPNPDNLTGVGQRAWQYDAAISFHHNSYSGSNNPYHCIMIDPAAPNSWKQYTSKMCIAMAKALDGTVADTTIMKGGTNGLDGVYEAELSVLNASAKDPDGKPPYHCLVEAYFLNPMTSVSACMEASRKAAEAIALFLSESPLP
jgi:N-acetylmuramoyl-L-alanine amidase